MTVRQGAGGTTIAGALAASANLNHAISTALAGSSTLSASAGLVKIVTATFAGSSELSASALLSPVSAFVSGNSSLAVSATIVKNVSTTLGATSTLSVSAVVSKILSTTLAANSTLSASAQRVINTTTTLEGNSTLSAQVTQMIFSLVSVLPAQGTISADLTIVSTFTSLLSTMSGLSGLVANCIIVPKPALDVITDTVTYVNKPIDYELADEPNIRDGWKTWDIRTGRKEKPRMTVGSPMVLLDGDGPRFTTKTSNRGH